MSPSALRGKAGMGACGMGACGMGASRTTAILLLFLLLLPLQSHSQSHQTWALPSRYVHRTDSVEAFYPASYDSTKTWPLVYLLHGYGGNHRQWPRITDCQWLADIYGTVIICPDAFDSWYLNAPSDSGMRMEDFFFKELVPYVHARTRVDTANIFIAGLSMGGYGALRYFLLHPGYFNAAASSSGALMMEYTSLYNFSNAAFKDSRMSDVIGRQLGLGKTEWPKQGIPHLLQTAKKPGPFLIDCGRDDYFFAAHKTVQSVTDSLKLPATVISRPGTHNRAFWQSGIGMYFAFFKEQRRTK